MAEIAAENAVWKFNWPDLLSAVHECVQSPHAHLRESGLRIISTVSYLFIGTGPQLNPKPMMHILHANLVDADPNSANEDVRVAAVEASVAVMIAVLDERNGVAGEFAGLVQDVLQALVQLQDEDKLSSCLQSLTELAEYRPILFKKNLNDLLQFVSGIMSNESLLSTTQQVSAELLITLAEKNPKFVKKLPQFTATLVPALFAWMASLEDVPTWYTTDDLSHDDDDSDENYVYAEQAVDRLALALGGESMLTIAFKIIPTYVSSEDWRQRHAGLMAISVLGEGCSDLMADSLQDVVNLVVPYLNDTHIRVRHAACNAIGQLCTDFSPEIQDRFGEIILSALVPLMDDATAPRIQAHAAAALVNFLDEADKFKIVGVAGDILRRLVGLLRSNKIYIQEQAVTSIATVADCIQENFAPYCPDIMPILGEILRDATDKKYRLLRGKTLECATLIGLAVKEEPFTPYVDTILQFLQQMQQTQRDDDDPVTSYLLVAWARVCKVIKHKFLPYLPIVMPPLLESAGVKPEVAILDNDDNFDEYPEEEGWDYITMGNQKLVIKTAVIEDKRTAVEMISTYARDLEEHFAPYVDAALKTTIPLVGFVFDIGVRQAAAGVAPLLLNCLKKANADNLQILPYWNQILEKLKDRLLSDGDIEFLADIYIALYESISYLGVAFLSPELMETLTVGIEMHLRQYLEKVAGNDGNDEDEEVVENEEEDFTNLLIEIGNAVHEFFKLAGLNFMPYFDRLSEVFKLCINSDDDSAYHFGIIVYGDLIDFGGPSSANHQSAFLPRILAALSHPSPDLRQAAAFAMGLCAERQPQLYTQACGQALPLLGAMIMRPTSRQHKNVMATENAVSAVGKICHFVGDAAASAAGFGIDQMLAHWVDALPILYDGDEATHTYTYLLSLLESNNPVVLGENNSNLPKVASILAQALVSDLPFSSDLKTAMVSALKVIASTCQLNVVELAAEERRHILQQLLV